MVAGINGASKSPANKKKTTNVAWSPAPPKKSKWKVYQNPGDGSVPARYPDEKLTDYIKRRNQGLKDAKNY